MGSSNVALQVDLTGLRTGNVTDFSVEVMKIFFRVLRFRLRVLVNQPVCLDRQAYLTRLVRCVLLSLNSNA